MIEREAFEHWYSNEGKWPRAVMRANNGDYLLSSAYVAWGVWQAAWAASAGNPADNPIWDQLAEIGASDPQAWEKP